MVKIKQGLAAIAAFGLAVSPAMAQTRSADSMPSKSVMIEPSTGQCVEIRRDSPSSTPTSVPVDQALCDAAGSKGVGGAASAIAKTGGLGLSPALLLALLAVVGAVAAAAGGGHNDSPG